MAVTYKGNRKIILAQDSEDSLTDALADLLLVHSGDVATVRALIEAKLSSALNHYEKEADGDSEGYHVFIDPQNDEPLIDLRKTPARRI